jgi:hypothetical protein
MSVEAYPLNWPTGWKRTLPINRTRAKFSTGRSGYDSQNHWVGKNSLTIAQATERVLSEMRTMHIDTAKVIISTNLELRNDGLPRSGQKAPTDPGVSVYWNARGQKNQRCIAIDRYDRVQDNLAAIAATLNAMRAIERHGGAEILDRAFTGFAALPAAEQPWQTLGLETSRPTRAQIDDAYRRLASQHHPDRPGGDEHQMARINAARDALIDALIGDWS